MKKNFKALCEDVERILDEDTVCGKSEQQSTDIQQAAADLKDTDLAAKGESNDGVLGEKTVVAFESGDVVKNTRDIVWDPEDDALEPDEVEEYRQLGLIGGDDPANPQIVFPAGTEFTYNANGEYGDCFNLNSNGDQFYFSYKPEYAANGYQDYFELAGPRNLREDDHDDDDHDDHDDVAIDFPPKEDKPEETSQEETNANGAVCMTTPLFLRLLEYAKEDAETDLDLHYAAENVLRLAADPGILGMDDYAEIIDIYDDNDEEDDIENVGEAKKKKRKYKKSMTNYLGRWGRYFPRIPWIVPCGILPPPPPGPGPKPPKPEEEGDNTTVAVPPADASGELSGPTVDGGGEGGGVPAAPIGESKMMDALNQIDAETLKRFIVKEFGSKFSSQKDITSGKDKQTDAIELTEIASVSNITGSDDTVTSALLFVKFKVNKGEWSAAVMFDSKTREFSRAKFLNSTYEIFQADENSGSEAAAALANAFPELHKVKKF